MLKNKRLLSVGILALLSSMSTLTAQDLPQALKAMDNGQLQQAKSMLEELIKQNPTSGINYYYLGDLYLKQNQVDSAKTIFKEGLELKDNGSLNYIGLGQIDLLNKDAQGAILNFAKAQSKIKRKDYDQKLLVAQGYLTGENPNYDMAISIANEVLQDDVQNSNAFHVLGQGLLGKGEVQPAYDNFRHAVATNPENNAAKLALSLILQKSGSYSQASSQLEQLIQSDPSFLPAYKALGDTYYHWSLKDKGQSSALQAKAAKAYQEYSTKNPSDISATQDYVTFLLDTSTPSKAIVLLDQLASKESGDANWTAFIGQSYYKAGDYSKAISFLQKNLGQSQGASPEVYFTLGSSYLLDTSNGEQNQQKAYEYLNKAISLDKNTSSEFNTLGVSLFRSKEYQKAIEVFKIATTDKTGSNYAIDLYYIGLCYYSLADQGEQDQTNYVAQATKYFDACLQSNPSIGEANFYKARANRLISEDPANYQLVFEAYDNYVNQFRKSEQLPDKTDTARLIEAYNWLGSYYANSDQKQKAIESFNMTLGLDNTNEYALKTIHALDGM
ncbi:tetratricopeptide repeat protein [Myroides sp. LJL116]